MRGEEDEEINLANDLISEKSQSLSSSLNFDYARENYIYGFTLEYFYTKLENAFYLDPSGTDNFGDLFTKRNGSGAIVKGLSLDLRMNYNKIIQFESGFTIQWQDILSQFLIVIVFLLYLIF